MSWTYATSQDIVSKGSKSLEQESLGVKPELRCRQIMKSKQRAERQINGEFEPGNVVIEGDDMPKLVESDLEDADQREATPGIKEQP